MIRTIDAFAAWLAEQKHRDDPIGDLARDAAEDPDWPPERMPPVDYLEQLGACDGAIEAMHAAIREFGATMEGV